MSDLPFKWKEINLLIVDEHPAIRTQLKKIAEKLGISGVHEFKNSPEAMEFLNNNQVDIVIADIYADKEVGPILLKYLRHRDVANDIPFLVLTGESGEKEIVLASDCGASEYILKPFKAENLETKIEKALTAYFTLTPFKKYIWEGDNALITRNYDLALTSYDAALKIDTTSIKAQFGLALAYFWLGNLDNAENLTKENVLKNADYYRNYRLLADIYLKRNKISEALVFLEKELAINSKQIDRHLLAGNLYLKIKLADKAMDHFRDMLLENPKERQGLIGMGHTFMMQDNMEKSFYYFRRVRRYYESDVKCLQFILHYALEKKAYKAAEIILKDERKRVDKDTSVHRLLIKLYWETQQWDEALQIAKEAIDINPDSPAFYSHLGKIYLKKNRPSDAIDCFVRSNHLEFSEEAFELLIRSYIKANRYADCVQVLEDYKNVSKNPYFVTALVECWLKVGESMKAHYFLKKILLDPKNRTPIHMDLWQRAHNIIRAKRNTRLIKAS